MEQHQNWLLCLNDRNLEFCLVELLAGGLCVLSGLFKLLGFELGNNSLSLLVLGLWRNPLAIVQIMLNFSEAEKHGSQIFGKIGLQVATFCCKQGSQLEHINTLLE